MSRSYRKPIVKTKWSAKIRPEEKRHKIQRMRVRQAFSRYGEDADLHLEPDNFYENEHKKTMNNSVVHAAISHANVVKRVLDVKICYVKLHYNSFEYDSKYGWSWDGKRRSEDLESWFPIASIQDFREASEEIGIPPRSWRNHGRLFDNDNDYEWYDWMEDPESMYEKVYQRK